MLTCLEIHDMILVDQLELEFRPGLNVLTGETGAGKSILLDCLGFVLGWNVQTGMLRNPEGSGEVAASFDLSDGHPVLETLHGVGVPGHSRLLLRRRLRPDGRTVAYVNDRRCTLETLRDVSGGLVEIVGQRHDRGLLDPGFHLNLLDQFAGTDLSSVKRNWDNWRDRRERLEAAQARVDRDRRETDFLRHAAGELDELAPGDGEAEKLDQERRLMRAAERVRDDVSRAWHSLGSHGAEGQISQAIGWLNGARTEAAGRLEGAFEALDRALEELAFAEREIADCLEIFDFSPSDLEEVEERLFALRRLARKHDVDPDRLSEVRESIKARLAAVEGSEAEVSDLAEQVRSAEASYRAGAAQLSERRRSAGHRLDSMMLGELPSLKLQDARFRTDVDDAPAGPNGSNAVRFLAATNPGMPAGPLNRIASGGELSRFLLALKACLATNFEPYLLVFDEIDRGVGGATANAVGRRLATLAKRTQVLVVTHSPQVAACADHHFLVSKVDIETRGSTLVDVVRLDPEKRIDELARMLAGSEVTGEARAAARALLSGQ
ncbi:MAG: DNA repair protein RecN [Rhodobacteraceae bacterium]|nr:DNA repair protein RecN [Paracoccaceae bacterium]